MDTLLGYDERLSAFEEKILSAGELPCIPPLSIIDDGRGHVLRYDTGGFAPMSSCTFTSLTEMYDLLRLYTLRLAEAIDRLLPASRLSGCEDDILIAADGKDLKLIITGAVRSGGDAPYERVAELATSMSTRTTAPGAGEAMRETAERLRARRPSLPMIQRVVTECEKKWRLILPS